MSLPTPTINEPGLLTPPSLSPQQQQQLDAPLIALAQRCNGDLRLLFHSFFSFLNRRTDFYAIHNQIDIEQGNKVQMGFKEGDAEKMLLAAFKQFPLRRMPPSSIMNVNRGKSADTGRVKTAIPSTKGASNSTSGAKKNNNTKKKDDAAKEVTKEKPNDAPPRNKNESGEQTVLDECHADVGTTRSFVDDRDKTELDGVRYTKEGDQIPVGNGGSTKDYKWTQTIDEITIAILLPKIQNHEQTDDSKSETSRVRAKDLNVQIKHSSISILLKRDSDNHILKGKFLEKIRSDESTWSIESNVLLITLEKITKRWWNRVLLDEDETIDIDLVDKTHKISDYDKATQGMIRKILFDQRQERLGLPASDAIENREIKKKNAGINMETSSTMKTCDGEELKGLPSGVEFIDKHNFPGSKNNVK